MFNTDVQGCVPIASLADDDPGLIQASPGPFAHTVTVNTAGTNTVLADNSFYVAVFCQPRGRSRHPATRRVVEEGRLRAPSSLQGENDAPFYRM